nr:protein FAR1-related sequence 5-like [Tanacetum cinerariifolium]GEW67412.1 protein FAR1-related sequence 5-like [Tanacetum cinerariifolium]GEW87992.1 protein FAR1-related sequence 5-like [Tanacetum cinerariifolium]GEW87995.1 protein FAR1-related sequence 5-like [Tanacetum cinerariifolium]
MSNPEHIFVQQLGSISIGATRAHHLYASTHGGYELVNATKTEYRNHKRDLNVHIGEGDAQMLITKMTNRKLHVDNFSFEYVVENSQLSALFWADEMSKYNYKEFGDTISLDATFRTNKLTRTTSRSESENSFFLNFTFWGSTLINFMMCFEAAMERQRHRQEILDDSTMQKIPRFKTKLPIERYAQKKYTKKMFTLIQEEINLAIYDYHQISKSLENKIETVTIKEIREIKVNTSRKKYNFGETSVQNKRNHTKKELRFKVSIDKSDGSMLCSCMNFVRFGFLCRHIFCVLKGNGLEVIPDKYIVKRWMRNLLPTHTRRKKQMLGFEGGRYMECSVIVYSAVEYCLNLLAKDEEKLLEFVENVKRLKTEKLREHMKKHMRLCKKCEKYRRHDLRNCTKKADEIPTDSDSTVVSD